MSVIPVNELDRREGGGLTVTLWWIPPDELYVTVEDNGLYTRVEVPEPKLAHQVFMHPYAYEGHAIEPLVGQHDGA